MYHLYIEHENDFSTKLIGDFNELEDAQKKLKSEKDLDPNLSYSIEETDGSFNSYGELISYKIEQG